MRYQTTLYSVSIKSLYTCLQEEDHNCELRYNLVVQIVCNKLHVPGISTSRWCVVMRLVVLVEDTVVLGCDRVRGGVHNDLSAEVESKSLTATLHLLRRLFLHGYHITVV